MIECVDLEGFMNVIEVCMKRGLTFKADYDMFTITLTGGY